LDKRKTPSQRIKVQRVFSEGQALPTNFFRISTKTVKKTTKNVSNHDLSIKLPNDKVYLKKRFSPGNGTVSTTRTNTTDIPERINTVFSDDRPDQDQTNQESSPSHSHINYNCRNQGKIKSKKNANLKTTNSGDSPLLNKKEEFSIPSPPKESPYLLIRTPSNVYEVPQENCLTEMAEIDPNLAEKVEQPDTFPTRPFHRIVKYPKEEKKNDQNLPPFFMKKGINEAIDFNFHPDLQYLKKAVNSSKGLMNQEPSPGKRVHHVPNNKLIDVNQLMEKYQKKNKGQEADGEFSLHKLSEPKLKKNLQINIQNQINKDMISKFLKEIKTKESPRTTKAVIQNRIDDVSNVYLSSMKNSLGIKQSFFSPKNSQLPRHDFTLPKKKEIF